MAAKKLIAELVGLELSQAEAAQSGSGAQFMVIWLDQAESAGSTTASRSRHIAVSRPADDRSRAIVIRARSGADQTSARMVAGD